jgi:hypothetical protein
VEVGGGERVGGGGHGELGAGGSGGLGEGGVSVVGGGGGICGRGIGGLWLRVGVGFVSPGCLVWEGAGGEGSIFGVGREGAVWNGDLRVG